MVVLDLDAGAYADDAEFELAVSAAASVGSRAIRDARSVSFVISGRQTGRIGAMRELPTVSRDRLVDALCVVERDEHVVPLPDVARSAAESLHGLSLAVLVTGTARGIAPMRSAASRVPPGVDVVAVQCAPEGEPTARTVAGLTVFGIGYLEDLRAMLARSASVA